MKKIILYLGIVVLGLVGVVALLSKATFGKVKEEYDKNKETIDQIVESAHKLSSKAWIEAAETKRMLSGDTVLIVTDPNYVTIKGDLPKSVEVFFEETGKIMSGSFDFEEASYEYDGKTVKKKEKNH